MKNIRQAKAVFRFYILSFLLFSLVILSSGCSLFDCTGCIMAGVILALIFYVLFGGRIPLVLLALYLLSTHTVANKMIRESCCSVHVFSAETAHPPDK